MKSHESFTSSGSFHHLWLPFLPSQHFAPCLPSVVLQCPGWQLWSPLRAHGARAGALQLCRWHGRGAALGRAAPRDRADASAARTAASGASHQRGPGGFDVTGTNGGAGK